MLLVFEEKWEEEEKEEGGYGGGYEGRGEERERWGRVSIFYF